METQVVPETQDDGYKWIALAIASLGTLVGILNASTLIIALPTMMVSLKTDLVGGMNMPVATQISFTHGITAVFILSCFLTVPAIIVSAMRGQ